MKRARKIKAALKQYKIEKESAKDRVFRTKYMERLETYCEYYEENATQENLILYESFNGRGLNDNPYAIFCKLINDQDFEGYKHIWVVDNLDDKQDLIHRFFSYVNVSFVEYGSIDYIKALTEAKYLINNVTFPVYFVKKPDQIYINTWHGTPLKKMGYDLKDGDVVVANIVRNFLCADYLISANSIMTEMYLRSHKLEGILPGKIIETGYPRNDFLSNLDDKSFEKELIHFGVQFDCKKKTVIYAPTWRGRGGSEAVIDAQGLLDVKNKLEALLGKDQYQVLIKPHQFVYEALKENDDCRGLLIPSFLDANCVLSIADILISDYSSIFLDYLATGRPILFFIPDLEEYEAERGVAWDPKSLPGPCTDKIECLADMIKNIDQIKIDYMDQYNKYRNQVCSYEDGYASDRVCGIIWKGARYSNAKIIEDGHKKKRLLISGGGLLQNGVVNSMLSLLHQIDYDTFDVSVYVARDPGFSNYRQMLAEEVDGRARVVFRTGTIGATEREEVKRRLVRKVKHNSMLYKYLYPHTLFEREWRRSFGDAEFDYIVDFNGFSTIYAPMLLCGKAQKKSIWLHSDIMAEVNREVLGKKPLEESLMFIISLYPVFDALVSCGKMIKEVNQDKIGNSVTSGRFVFAKNTVNEERMKRLIEGEQIITADGNRYLLDGIKDDDKYGEMIKAVKLPNEDEISFVTMGRLSTEKNHLALIRAFARVHEKFKNATLYIIGDGPLREVTEREIVLNRVEDCVYMTGLMTNPFSLMKRAKCFVLPSHHEGQPLVLLEARALGLPIIVSDFSTVKESSFPNGQLIIHSDENSIYEGLCAFIEGNVPTTEFSLAAYNRDAYQEFINAIT